MIQVMMVIIVIQVIKKVYCIEVKLMHVWVDFSSYHNRYMIVHLCSCNCCLFLAIFKFITLLVSLTCGIWEHASSLHPLWVLSEIVTILGIEVTFQIQNTNLLLCSLDRYTPMVFPTYEIGHVWPSPLLLSATYCISHTERQGCEK